MIHVMFALSVFIEGIIFAVFGGTTWPVLQVELPLPAVDYSGIESSCQATGVNNIVYLMNLLLAM